MGRQRNRDTTRVLGCKSQQQSGMHRLIRMGWHAASHAAPGACAGEELGSLACPLCVTCVPARRQHPPTPLPGLLADLEGLGAHAGRDHSLHPPRHLRHRHPGELPGRPRVGRVPLRLPQDPHGHRLPSGNSGHSQQAWGAGCQQPSPHSSFPTPNQPREPAVPHGCHPQQSGMGC